MNPILAAASSGMPGQASKLRRKRCQARSVLGKRAWHTLMAKRHRSRRKHAARARRLIDNTIVVSATTGTPTISAAVAGSSIPLAKRECVMRQRFQISSRVPLLCPSEALRLHATAFSGYRQVGVYTCGPCNLFITLITHKHCMYAVFSLCTLSHNALHFQHWIITIYDPLFCAYRPWMCLYSCRNRALFSSGC